MYKLNKKYNNNLLFYFFVCCFMASACQDSNKQNQTAGAALTDSTRMVSLDGSLTEIIAAAGYTDQLVGVDVTSTYPPEVKDLPHLGHTRNMQAEGIIAQNPDWVWAIKGALKPELRSQLKSAGVRLLTLEHKHTVKGTKQLISQVTDTLNKPNAGKGMIEEIDRQMEKVTKLEPSPKVLFIYARGRGNMMVAGKETPMQKVISLAGGQNAVTGFSDFKPLNAEALIKANPDAILLFKSGLKSLQGPEGLMKVKGIKETDAGKAKAFITMEGQLLSGFSPRLAKAVLQLNQKLESIQTNE
jgi:iron complex transport system substrate-binding protein